MCNSGTGGVRGDGQLHQPQDGRRAQPGGSAPPLIGAGTRPLTWSERKWCSRRLIGIGTSALLWSE
eukprot:3118610-Pyramimonas_sp.AAC.2